MFSCLVIILLDSVPTLYFVNWICKMASITQIHPLLHRKHTHYSLVLRIQEGKSNQAAVERFDCQWKRFKAKALSWSSAGPLQIIILLVRLRNYSWISSRIILDFVSKEWQRVMPRLFCSSVYYLKSKGWD